MRDLTLPARHAVVVGVIVMGVSGEEVNSGVYISGMNRVSDGASLIFLGLGVMC